MDAIERIYDEELTNFFRTRDHSHIDKKSEKNCDECTSAINEINERYFIRRQELRKLIFESDVPNKFMIKVPKFFMPKYFYSTGLVYLPDKVIGKSKNYFIVPCNYLKRINYLAAIIKVDKEYENLINKNARLLGKKYNSYGVYVEEIHDLHKVSFSEKLNNSSFENICAVKIEIHAILLSNVRLEYRITQLYRRLNLLYFINTSKVISAIFSEISHALVQVCAAFNMPTEIMSEIAQYIFIIRKEDYSQNCSKFRTQN